MNFKFRKPREFYIKILGIFLAVFGFAEAVFSVFQQIGLNKTLVFVVFGILITFLIVIIFLPKHNFPTDNIGPFNLNEIKKAKIYFPCDEEHFKIANKLAKKLFGKKNAINPTTIDSWRKKNHLILSVLYDDNNRIVGYFDILPITAEFEENLRNGIYTEQNIISDSIYSKDDINLATNLYIGGIGVIDSETYDGHKNGAILIRAMVKYIKTFYDLNTERKLCAVAATKDGEKLLLNMGFQIEKQGSLRKDGMDYYSRKLSIADIKYFEKNHGRLDNYIDYTNYDKYKKNYGS